MYQLNLEVIDNEIRLNKLEQIGILFIV